RRVTGNSEAATGERSDSCLVSMLISALNDFEDLKIFSTPHHPEARPNISGARLSSLPAKRGEGLTTKQTHFPAERTDTMDQRSPLLCRVTYNSRASAFPAL